MVCQNPLPFPPVAVEIVANRGPELTDVKIYLEGNHAANRGAEGEGGCCHREGPGRPRPGSTHPWERLGAGGLCHGPERCSWINVAYPRLSCSLCLIDADGFSSAFVGGGNALFVVAFTTPPPAFTLQSFHGARRFTHTRLLLFISGEKMAAISPTETVFMPYVAYFSFCFFFNVGSLWQGTEGNSGASVTVAVGRSEASPYSSGGGEVKKPHSLAPCSWAGADGGLNGKAKAR